ncbi:MAG: aspartate kinase [Candidatus Kentron sp. G]|nr:MAG: aspartate kinase [Candidatus Kentron sp. G]VFN02608.1 MAG: aspartate kinase [Candidatus Kentron sp. G]VFN02726.1 MAG: aspartate kinase [Candidatus Kentron sp. G]
MSLIVQKYGGTSVGTVERIMRIAKRIHAIRQAGDDVVVVVSAMSGETDRLIELATAITPRPNSRELDVLLATGEQVTIALLSMALEAVGCPAHSYTGGQARILTDGVHSKARITQVEHAKVSDDLAKGYVAVIAGFQGTDQQGDITTLGRGGSDTTAVAMAAALQADECQIYTDVDGVYTTDPRVAPRARRLDVLAFEEMLELASLGAKVLQIRAVEFASKYNVPLRVLSSFGEGEGTLVTAENKIPENKIMEQPLISGIAFTRNEAKLTVLGVADRPGIAHSILGPVAEANIEVDMIVQNVSREGTTDFTFTVNRNDYEAAFGIIRDIAQDLGAREVTGDDRIAKISLVGVGMRSHAGIASRMFDTLAREGINIRMISTSEIKISVVVEEKYLELGVRALHEDFGLEHAGGNGKAGG